MESTCSCVAGKTGYCNHSLALMLKLCKFFLFESKSTQDLVNDADQNPEESCTSRLQTWHRKGRGDITGAPNDGFLPNALKRCFRLSGVLLKLCRLILGCAIKFLSVRFF